MLILNEEKYAENLYCGNNDEVKTILAKIGYITRYHLYVLNYDDADNYKFTVEWMCQHHNHFDESYYSNLISDAVKRAHKMPFYKIENIKVTQSELDIISSLTVLSNILFLIYVSWLAYPCRQMIENIYYIV